MAFHRKKPAAIGVKAPFPGFVEPALATSIERIPSGSRWLHEIKFDGSEAGNVPSLGLVAHFLVSLLGLFWIGGVLVLRPGIEGHDAGGCRTPALAEHQL
jgi:hypothetical protein